MTRRSLFALFAGAPALPAAARHVIAVTPRNGEPIPPRRAETPMPVEGPIGVLAYELIESSLRLLGVLAAGQHPSHETWKAADFVLQALEPRFADYWACGVSISPGRVRQLRWALAFELAPEFGVTPWPLLLTLGSECAGYRL